MSDTKSCLSHVSVGVKDVEASGRFYDATLGAIGIKRILAEPEHDYIAYGRAFPEFWVQRPHDKGNPSVGNGTHVGFFARSREEVHAFFDAGVKAGGRPDGEPGPRPQYGAPYYGCFLRDPDGHKIEAMFWDHSIKEPKS